VHNWYPKPGATVGASGGLFGLLGAALVILYRQDKGEGFRKWIWIALTIGLGVSLLPNISMAGHIGGIIGGTVTGMLFQPRRKPSARREF
jgi:rhomboid protease GluP